MVDGQPLPDPLTRWQPEGLRGPSRLFDTRALPGARDAFTAPRPHDLVVYELHIGTFSEEGTFTGAIAHLDELADARGDGDRDHAGGRVPRRARLGV